MDVAVKQLPKSQVELKISISPGEMKGYFEKAVQRVAEQANLPGFRKGKAPRTVLEARTGPDYIAHEAMELAVADSYYQAVKKHDLRPVGRPQTDLKHEHKHLEQNGLSYTATVPVLPEVKLGDYKKISVRPAKSEFSETQVDEALEQLRAGRASNAQVERAAKTGDRVEIDFVGMRGGKEVPGAKSEHHPLVLGKGGFIPGFEDELVGMQRGQVKKFKITFPKNYGEKSLAGQPVEFTATMRSVQEVKLPKLDDAFATGFGAKSLADLRKRLTANLQAEKEAEAKLRTEQALAEQLLKRSTVEVPDSLIDEELDRMIGELRQRVEGQGLKLEQYLEQTGKREDEIRQSQRGEAERRVKLSMVLNALQEKEGITVPEERVRSEIETQQALAQDERTKQQVKSDEFKTYVRRILGNRLVLERLLAESEQLAKSTKPAKQ